MSTKRRRTESTQGSKTHPQIWGLPLKFTFQATKHWANTIVQEVEPIDLAQYANAPKNVMEIMNGSYLMGGVKYPVPGNSGYTGSLKADCTVIIITTSFFDVASDDGISPLQLETDTDTIFRASVQEGNDQGLQRRDMEVLPQGSRITVVRPKVYIYAWRGDASMAPNVVEPVEAQRALYLPASNYWCSIKLAYYMTAISPTKMLTEYIQETENAGPLKFIPEI